jgi:2-dehydro-3-deoxyphosphogluconate aldolase/(4S)-4-hydroxy-2-oxoglutarate aldolase
LTADPLGTAGQSIPALGKSMMSNRTTLFSATIANQLSESGVIAVLMIDDPADAVPLASALLSGGVNAMELTLRTPAALDALRAIRSTVPDMLAGMGTVLSPGQVQDVATIGAAFGVAPGTNRRVISAAVELGLSFAPGVVTPTDVEAALELGCRVLKFFPAEPSGGLPFLKSMAAPFAHLEVQYIPLGGINLDNLESYLADDNVLAVGGSWLAPRDLIARKDWRAIEQRAREARQRIDALNRARST